MIQPGNTKLGGVHAFSLPVHFTCPGETAVCAAECYAKQGFFKMSNVKASHIANWDASKKDDFVTKMVTEIRAQGVTVLRIHVSGDFYSTAYVLMWVEIAKQCPNVEFYAYTRSWRISDMLPSLIAFSELQNVHLWWSIDADTVSIDGRPPVQARVRVAYMEVEHGEPIPDYTDLVFRVKRDTLAKFVDGKLVCPAENGMKYNPVFKKMTCKKCGLCLKDRAIPCKPVSELSLV